MNKPSIQNIKSIIELTSTMAIHLTQDELFLIAAVLHRAALRMDKEGVSNETKNI